jgi:hypothetical protein
MIKSMNAWSIKISLMIVENTDTVESILMENN